MKCPMKSKVSLVRNNLILESTTLGKRRRSPDDDGRLSNSELVED
jgi:hypothetical protein